MLLALAGVVLQALSAKCALLYFYEPETALMLRTTSNVSFYVNETGRLAVFHFTSSDPNVVRVNEHFTSQTEDFGFYGSVSLTALRIGFATLMWEAVGECGNATAGNPGSVVCHSGNHEVRVVRGQDTFTIGLGILIGILVALNNINVGCQLDMAVVVAQVKKPVAPAIGMLCQFLFMPLVSYGMGMLLLSDVVSRLGLFTIGCCPGGIYSNFYTLLFQGDLHLSVTMTFLSTLGALGMMPLWMYTLGKAVTGSAVPAVPYTNIIVALVALTLPLAIGLLIQYRRPNWAKTSQRIVRPFSVSILLVAFVVGTYSYWHLLSLLRGAELLAASGVAILGFLFGAGIAWIARLNKSQIIAVSLETAIQNTPLALVILTLSLPQPNGDIAIVPVIMLVSITGIVLLTSFFVLTVYKKIRKRPFHDLPQEMELKDENS
ncbi:ileal sodium/bile acid cotransporter-like [Ornithodoros turicata]|uniref:ileal sodium/bile acid cotransporter-like n=1 Tax=Ornithodoros turicata TaxID=34597 RepID=UPI00313A1856